MKYSYTVASTTSNRYERIKNNITSFYSLWLIMQINWIEKKIRIMIFCLNQMNSKFICILSQLIEFYYPINRSLECWWLSITMMH